MPIAEMTSIAARLAMDEPVDGEAEIRNYVVAPSLVVRESTGEAPER
jgi:hypothetical protein